MKKTNKKYIVICVAVILIIAIMVIYEITGNKNNSSQTDKSEYSVSTTDNEKNNADNFISDNKETQIRDDYAEIYDYEYQGNYARVKLVIGELLIKMEKLYLMGLIISKNCQQLQHYAAL